MSKMLIKYCFTILFVLSFSQNVFAKVELQWEMWWRLDQKFNELQLSLGPKKAPAPQVVQSILRAAEEKFPKMLDEIQVVLSQNNSTIEDRVLAYYLLLNIQKILIKMNRFLDEMKNTRSQQIAQLGQLTNRAELERILQRLGASIRKLVAFESQSRAISLRVDELFLLLPQKLKFKSLTEATEGLIKKINNSLAESKLERGYRESIVLHALQELRFSANKKNKQHRWNSVDYLLSGLVPAVLAEKLSIRSEVPLILYLRVLQKISRVDQAVQLANRDKIAIQIFTRMKALGIRGEQLFVAHSMVQQITKTGDQSTTVGQNPQVDVLSIDVMQALLSPLNIQVPNVIDVKKRIASSAEVVVPASEPWGTVQKFKRQSTAEMRALAPEEISGAFTMFSKECDGSLVPQDKGDRRSDLFKAYAPPRMIQKSDAAPDSTIDNEDDDSRYSETERS